MGRLVGPPDRRRQKGVDSLIVRDLIVLARERAICTAYLLAGDEDLREGVATAQEQGLQVILLGIPATWDPANQAQSLIREADEHVILPHGFWNPHLTKSVAPEVVMEEPPGDSPIQIGEAFALAWAKKASPDDLRNLLDDAPRIPVELDVQMIVEAERSLESLRGRDIEKRQLRAGFWAAIKKLPLEA